jgi:riboflavin kinase/FMN adenylyltransferase
VVEGNKLGRTIGYPTANLLVSEEKKLIPGNGVYAVEISIQPSINNDTSQQPEKLSGMMNIGVRPTVEGVNRMIEVNIFDFDEEIYGEVLTIHIKKRLRNEQKFNGLDELKEQLAKDKVQAIAALKGES